MSAHFKGILFGLASGIFWGLSGVSGEYLFKIKHFDPVFLTSFRLFISGLIMFVFMNRKSRIFNILKDKKSIYEFLFFAAFGLGLCQLTYYLTIHYSNAAVATTLQYTAPAMIMLWVCLREKIWPSVREFAALICAILGVFLFSTHANLSFFIISKEALFIGLVSAVCVAIYSIAPIRINKIYGINSILSLGLIISGVAFFAVFRNFNFPTIDIGVFWALIGVILIGTICGFSFYFISVSLIGPKKASLIASIEPAAAALFGYALLGTKFVFYDILGFFLIILCTILISKK